MGQIQIVDRGKRYIPALEGIRGYGFLLVFCGHYFWPGLLTRPNLFAQKAYAALASLAIFAVPAFFVLSGYLITGILHHTRNREGYFRVFYARRILRIFPVYYVTLLVITGFCLSRGVALDYHFWVHFLYIHNLFPGAWRHLPTSVGMVHLWSLAVEEQFYLIWPMIVWIFPSRRKLVAVTGFLIALSCAARIVAPLCSSRFHEMSNSTIIRADAILLGALIALCQQDRFFIRMRGLAKWIALLGVAALMSLACWKDEAWRNSYWGNQILIPLANIIAASLVIAVMEEGRFLNRACSQRWACWLGNLSYSLYVFHLTFSPFFFHAVSPWLSHYMRHFVAALVSGAVAFCLTLTLSLLSYRFIEGPIINFKRHLSYGAAGARVPKRELVAAAEPELVNIAG